MSNAPRLLISTGLVLTVLGMLLGLSFSYVVDHQPRLVAHDAYGDLVEASGSHEPQAHREQLRASLDARSIAHRRATDSHAHAINMGMLLMLIGLFVPIVASSGAPVSRSLALTAVAAAFLYPMGLVLQLGGWLLPGEIVAAIGGALVVTSLALLFWRIHRGLLAMESARKEG